MNATDVADYLTKNGVPFRSSHEIVGKMVLYCIHQSKTIEDLTLEEFTAFSPVFKEDILGLVLAEQCIASKISSGSTSKTSVASMLESAKEFLASI